MKIIDNDKAISIIIQNKTIEEIENVKKYIKEIILNLKKRKLHNISGIYNVDIYSDEKIGIILNLNKEEDFAFLKDVIDLNININKNSTIYLEFDDIFLVKNFKDIYTSNNKYYLDIKNINKEEFLKLTEFSNYIYGEKLEKLKTKLFLVVKNN